MPNENWTPEITGPSGTTPPNPEACLTTKPQVLLDPYTGKRYFLYPGSNDIAELETNNTHVTADSSELRANNYSRDTTPDFGANSSSSSNPGLRVNNPRLDAQELPVNYP